MKTKTFRVKEGVDFPGGMSSNKSNKDVGNLDSSAWI